MTDAGEFRSLADLGIASIGLKSDGKAYVTANGDVTVFGQSTFTKADGSGGLAADASFAAASLQNSAVKADQIRSGNLTTSIVAAALVGLVVEENPAAAYDNGNNTPDRVVSENAPAADSFKTVAIADLQDNLVQSASTPSHDFVQSFGEVESSARAVDDSDFFADIHDAPLSQISELLANSSEPQTPGIANSVFAFGGGDSVMHSMLDMAAADVKPASNDNLATTTLDDVVRGAMPDNMVDRLIEAFDADLGEPSVGSGIADNAGYLLQVINQSVTNFQAHSGIGIEPAGPTFQDMMALNNG